MNDLTNPSSATCGPLATSVALLSAAALALACLPAATAQASDAEALRFFEMKIRPLLAAECFDCHGEDDAKGGLRVDHIEFLLEGGDTGPALVRGEVEESLLVEAVRRTDSDFAMPPKTTLEPEQVALLEEWVAMGAPWPEERVARVERDEHGFTAEDYEWWAAQPLAEVEPPAVESDWVKNSVDAFIIKKLDEVGLSPAAEADANEMARRIHFDLHGLPPTPEEVEVFALAYKEDADRAVVELVDRLLDHPRYGERWGQHWLDVVRYAESDGYRADDVRPDAWRYRDYVIRSFNEDKPYDQFVREQLAADEISPDDPDTLVATAFLRHGIYEWNQRNSEMQWELIMTEMTNVTSEAFLGLGVGCAECHDHKFDPILQKDYYALQAFLNTVWWPEGETLATPEQREEHARLTAAWEETAAEILTELAEMEQPHLDRTRKQAVERFPEDVQAMYWKPVEERSAYEDQVSSLVQRQVDNDHRRLNWENALGGKEGENFLRRQKLLEELAKFDELKPEPLPTAFVATDVKPVPAETKMKTRGGSELIEPAFLAILGGEKPEIQPTAHGTTGRRSALADWIASEENPFTARVMANRVWQRHFATGLVATPNDFGRLGEPPTHPELFDWLTARFLEEGWRVKPLHRLIMTSAAYRQTSRREPTTNEVLVDSDNLLLWRFPPQRLDAEQIRDSMLLVSGELRERDGGPSVNGDNPSRSVYVLKRRNTQDALLGQFDLPMGFSSSPERLSTTTPTQALQLVNGKWTMDRAGAFAKRLLGNKTEIGTDEIREAFRLAYGREALSAEVEGALAFIATQREIARGSLPEDENFPGENGLRPSTQHFKESGGIDVGGQALWLQPGSRFEKLEASDLALPTGGFTIQAVANLDGIYKNSSVNTLFSRWNGSNETPGWTFGVTSEASRYAPRNFIMQLIGRDFQNEQVYEVVPSGLRFPLNAPTYLAATITATRADEKTTHAEVTFYLKDLSDPEAPLQTATVSHQIVGGLANTPDVRTFIGGRDQNGHLWDGQLARLVVSPGALAPEQLLVNGGSAEGAILDWNFDGDDGEEPERNTAWVREGDSADTRSDLLVALTDFCHALFNSNEFLYLH